MPGAAANPGGERDLQRCILARALTVVYIALTAAVSLIWSHQKLLSQDEMYAFQTDRVPTLARLVEVQRLWPISLDPLVYHALSHLGMQVFGVGVFALRLPAFLGFLLMQVCLFFLVRELAGERAGLLAAAAPAMTATLFYSAEGRPYGLLLGLYAAALLCWVRSTGGVYEVRGARRWWLVGLALAIALTINSHYFGILLLVPVCAAELARTFLRKRLDWPMAGAIAVGMAGFAGTLPFLQGAGEFKKHYYNGGAVGLHDITRSYRSIFIDYTAMSMRAQHATMVLLVAFAAALAWGCWQRWKGGDGRLRAAEWILLLALAGLPFCGYLIARFVTHSIEVRYVLGALVGIAALLGIAAAPALRRDGVFAAVALTLGVGIVGVGALRIVGETRTAAETMASLRLPAEVKADLEAQPGRLLYIQDMGRFEVASYYEPDAAVRARMALVYSADEELRWNLHDTMFLTATHMQQFTAFPIVSYESLRAAPGEKLFVLYHTGWDWTDQAFAQDGAKVRDLGTAMDGDAAAVSFQGR